MTKGKTQSIGKVGTTGGTTSTRLFPALAPAFAGLKKTRRMKECVEKWGRQLYEQSVMTSNPIATTDACLRSELDVVSGSVPLLALLLLF